MNKNHFHSKRTNVELLEKSYTGLPGCYADITNEQSHSALFAKKRTS